MKDKKIIMRHYFIVKRDYKINFSPNLIKRILTLDQKYKRRNVKLDQYIQRHKHLLKWIDPDVRILIDSASSEVEQKK